MQSGNTYLQVPYSEKEEAKVLGARWDGQKRKWYVPSGKDTSPFERWLSENDEQEEENQ